MTKNGQRYDQQFKDDILRLIHDEKRSVASIVKDFGVNYQTVRNWPKEHKNRQDPFFSRISPHLLRSNKKYSTLVAEIESMH